MSLGFYLLEPEGLKMPQAKPVGAKAEGFGLTREAGESGFWPLPCTEGARFILRPRRGLRCDTGTLFFHQNKK